MMTRAEIEAALALAEKATPGPWAENASQEAVRGPQWWVAWIAGDDDARPMTGDEDHVVYGFAAEDREFIASSRTLVPALAREALAQMDENQKLIQMLHAMRGEVTAEGLPSGGAHYVHAIETIVDLRKRVEKAERALEDANLRFGEYIGGTRTKEDE